MGNEVKTSEAKRIMIVDDVEANRFILRNIIVDMGHQPVLAENGVQALKIIEHIMPHLILLDVSMPQMDGFEFCEIIKADPKTRDIPVIFISAFDEPEDVIKGFNVGGEDYVTKPFIKEVVKARVNVHLKLSDANANLLSANRQLTASIQAQLKQMEQEKKNVLYALVSVARENACYEEAHMERLQYNCKILAQAMQLSPKYEQKISDTFIETIELSAPLCDLGNVAIPTDILQKDTCLDEHEADIMRTHTVIGAKILNDVETHGDYNDFVKMSIDIAKSHHENWDGSGYPEGLKGDDIPLAAQIVSIISAYCALTEKRTYRGVYNCEEAIKIMGEESGKQFNSDIYDICKKIYRQFR